MSRIDGLIAELVPGGVEYKRLDEIGELVRGNGLQKKDFIEAGVGCIHYGQIYTYYGTWTTQTKSFVAPELAARLAKVDPGDLIITNTSENIDDVCKVVAWLGDSHIVTGGHATVLKHNEDSKFLSYYFQTPAIYAQKKKLATGTKVIDVSAKSLANFQVPVPPLEIQREIVRVLDAFTQLEAELEVELEVELEARRVQYAYYRDRLLTFPEDEDAQWTTLGNVGEFVRGRRFTKADYVESGLGCIHYGQIYTDYGTSATSTVTFLDPRLKASLRMAKKGDVVIAATGENVEDVGKAVAWLGDDEVAVHDDCQIFRHTLNPKYASYFFQSASFHEQKIKFASESKVVRISGTNLARMKIQVPPREEQERVVAILDKFDELIADISVGLPAEIAARREQYEYYRDRLLTFDEAVA